MAAAGWAQDGGGGWPWRRIACLFAAVVSLGLGLVLAASHALAPWGAPALLLLWAMLVWRWPGAWLIVLPTLLPVANLSPWTGALMFDESDLLVLGAAAGGYARRVFAPTGATLVPQAPAFSRIAQVALGALTASTLISLALGLMRAGPVDFGLYQQYTGWLNPLRVAKSLLLALLLLPLMRVEFMRSPAGAMRCFTTGICCGLALAGCGVLWERAAFPGLFDFSRFYRVTATFWEMHLGGAALDFYLALTIPFAVALLIEARRRTSAWLAAVLLVLAAYACVATYSRGLYLAIGIAAVLTLALRFSRPAAWSPLRSPALRGLVWLLLVLMALFLAFRAQAYAGGLAIAVLATAAMPIGTPGACGHARLPWKWMGLGLCFGAVAALATSALSGSAWAHLFALGMLLMLSAALAGAGGRRANLAALLFGWFSAAAIATLGSAGGAAWRDAFLAVALVWLALACNLATRWQLWPVASSSQRELSLAIVLLVEAAALTSGESYLARRFDLADRDFSGRLARWHAAVAMLQSPADWLFGRGIGRFPAEFPLPPRSIEGPGGYALMNEDGNRFARVSGPRSIAGLGGVFALSQRLTPNPGADYRVSLDVRSVGPAELFIRICERHLIYEAGCADGSLPVAAGDWRRVEVNLDGARLAGGPWYAPRSGFFSVGAGVAQAIDVDNLTVRQADGASQMVNGDFDAAGARWFPTGRYYYFPWHIDNMYLETLIGQGLLGLLSLLALVALALAGLRKHGERSPTRVSALAAALVGALVVGLLGSMQNAPRVMLLFWLLLWIFLLSRRVVASVRATCPEDRHASGPVAGKALCIPKIDPVERLRHRVAKAPARPCDGACATLRC